MRYAVYGATIEQIAAAGGSNIKAASSIKMIFATLSPVAALTLQNQGFTITPVSRTSTDILPPTITPPTPLISPGTYTTANLLELSGFESIRTVTDPSLYGENMHVAIIDTGIRETHVGLAGRVVYSKNFTSSPMTDNFNHGTGVAGIVVEALPKIGLLNLKVIGDDGTGTDEDAALAINECIRLYDEKSEITPSVINLSLGCPDSSNPDDILRVACRAAIERNIIVVAAAGNGGSPQTITSPATERYVIAVGSIDIDPFILSSFSSRGPTIEGLVKPDVVIFGQDIVVLSSESDTATTGRSGTSYACPFGSAFILGTQEGLLRRVQYPEGVPRGLDPEAVGPLAAQETIDYWIPRLTTKPEGIPMGKDNDYGYGMPFGDLFADLMARTDISLSIGALLAPMMMIGIMGVMVKGASK